MLLEVFVSSAIFNELGGARQHVWVGVEGDRLNDIGGQEVHKGLDLMHLVGHHGGHGIDHREGLEEGFSGDSFSLKLGKAKLGLFRYLPQGRLVP